MRHALIRCQAASWRSQRLPCGTAGRHHLAGVRVYPGVPPPHAAERKQVRAFRAEESARDPPVIATIADRILRGVKCGDRGARFRTRVEPAAEAAPTGAGAAARPAIATKPAPSATTTTIESPQRPSRSPVYEFRITPRALLTAIRTPSSSPRGNGRPSRTKGRAPPVRLAALKSLWDDLLAARTLLTY